MSWNSGFNQGFKYTFSGDSFRRGFSKSLKKILTLLTIEPPVTVPSLLTAPPIVTTNFFINTIEYDIYPIDFTFSAGPNYTIFAASASLYPSKEVIVRRVDSNTFATLNIVDYSNPTLGSPLYLLNIGSELLLKSDGVSWTITSRLSTGNNIAPPPGNTIDPNSSGDSIIGGGSSGGSISSGTSPGGTLDPNSSGGLTSP